MLTYKFYISLCVLLFASVNTAAERNVGIRNGIHQATIEDIVLDMVDKIKHLETKVEHLEDKVSSLEDTFALKNEKISDLEQAVTDMNNVKEVTLEENDLDMAAGNDGGNHVVRSLSESKHRGTRQSEIVAFSVVMTNAIQHLGDKQTIKFNKVLLNDGNGYVPNTGVFTAPITGTYLFIFNFGHHGTGETWLELVKNGNIQNGAAVEGQFASQNLQGGNAAIIKVVQGDTVWVETFQVSDVTAQGTFTTFSGVFLY